MAVKFCHSLKLSCFRFHLKQFSDRRLGYLLCEGICEARKEHQYSTVANSVLQIV